MKTIRSTYLSGDGSNSSSDSDDVENECNLDLFARVTRNSSTLKRVEALVRKFEDEPIEPNDDMLCIIGCGKKKNMLLLPCCHQHTCEPCWILWKMTHSRRIPNTIFDQTFEENSLKPKCPVCKAPVDQEIRVFN